MVDFPASELGNLTATGILGWYAWHTASKTIPGLLSDFRDELAAQRGEQRVQTKLFHAEMVAERERRFADSLAIVNALNALSSRVCGNDGPDENGRQTFEIGEPTSRATTSAPSDTC